MDNEREKNEEDTLCAMLKHENSSEKREKKDRQILKKK